MNKIARNYIYNLLYQLLVIFVPLITAPYLARTLGATNVGIYGYVHSTTNLVCMLVMLGIYAYGNRQIAYIRDDKKQVDLVFWEIMSTRFVIGVFGSIVYFAIAIAINRYVGMFAIYYTYLLAYFLDCTWLYVGVEDMKWAVLKNAVTKLLAVFGIFIFVKDNNDLWKYVAIQGGSLLISNLLAYSQLKQYVGRPKWVFTNLWKDIRESFLLFLPSIASAIYLQVDKIMIELMTGKTAEVSFYDYSEKLVTIPLTFITVLSTVMMPRIANEFHKGNKRQIDQLINRSTKFSIFIACPLMFGLIAVADKLIPWYLGEEFMGVAVAMSIIAPIILSNTLVEISGNQYFTATNQIHILLKSQVAAAVLNVLVNAILIPKYGFVGAAVATVISSGLNAAIQYYHLAKQVKLVDFVCNLIVHFIMALVMYVVVKWLTGNMSPTPMTSLLQLLLGVTSYFILAILIKDEQLKTGIDIIKSKVRK